MLLVLVLERPGGSAIEDLIEWGYIKKGPGDGGNEELRAPIES